VAAGRRSRLAKPDVGGQVEDGVLGRRARLAGAEERLGLCHRHREHLADVHAAEGVAERLCLEVLACDRIAAAPES
jgi:hypothetical protein